MCIRDRSTHLKMGDGTNFGQALEWGVKNFVENGQADVLSLIHI